MLEQSKAVFPAAAEMVSQPANVDPAPFLYEPADLSDEVVEGAAFVADIGGDANKPPIVLQRL